MPSIFEMWHPVTHDFGLIQTPLDRLLSEFQSWNSSLGIEYKREEITTSLSDAFKSLLPLSNSKMRSLFFKTKSDWVACFQNGIQGSDPFPAMSFLAGRLGVLSMRVCCTPDSARYPAVIWEVYAPPSLGGSSPLNYLRSVAAANDGGRWVFHESGNRFSFERVERYSERRKRDRFTRQMLSDYLAHFGLNPFSDDFFKVSTDSPAIKLQRTSMVWHTPEFSLEEVIAGAPWRKSRQS